MNETRFIKVGNVRVNQDHIVSWEYMPAVEGGKYDPETGDTTTRRNATLEVTTTALKCAPKTDFAGERYVGVGTDSVVYRVSGDQAEILKDYLNRMVVS